MKIYILVCTAIIFLYASSSASAQYSPPPPYFGTNPTSAEVKAKLIAAGQTYHIPPHILFGIAMQESNWKQFRSDGRTTYHLEPDGRVGVGIMQITIFPNDPNYALLCTNIDENIKAGAILLKNKYDYSTPIIGNNSTAILENWYYAIWAYNGFVYNCATATYCNDPRSVPVANTYQRKVIDNIANSSNGQWINCRISEPTNADIGPNGSYPQRIANTPAPMHTDANYDGVIDDDSSSGTQIYVSTTGNDISGNGSLGNPFKTVTKAIQIASSDLNVKTTIHIKGGNYPASTYSQRKNLYFVNDGGGPAIIGR